MPPSPVLPLGGAAWHEKAPVTHIRSSGFPFPSLRVVGAGVTVVLLPSLL